MPDTFHCNIHNHSFYILFGFIVERSLLLMIKMEKEKLESLAESFVICFQFYSDPLKLIDFFCLFYSINAHMYN